MEPQKFKHQPRPLVRSTSLKFGQNFWNLSHETFPLTPAFLWSISVQRARNNVLSKLPCFAKSRSMSRFRGNLSQLKVWNTFFMSSKVYLRMWSGRKCMCTIVSSTYDFLSLSNSSKLYQKLNSVGILLFGSYFMTSQFTNFLFLGGGGGYGETMK